MLTLLLVILSVMRIPILFQELPPFQFCDESIYFDEVVRLHFKNEWLTHEFRSGGFNIYPILLLTKIVDFFHHLSNLDILVIGKFFYLVMFGTVAGYGFYKVGKDIGGSKVGIVTLILYMISPYVYSVSRYWYPDHYIAAAVVWMLHFAIKYDRSDKNERVSLIACSTLLGVCISIKYTSLLLALPIILFVIKKIFKRFQLALLFKEGIFLTQYFVFPLVITVFLLNFSVFYDFQGFLNGFKFNVNNYGPRDFWHLDGILF